MNKRILLIFAILITAFHGRADKVSFKMSAPSIVQMNEQFRLSFEVNQQGQNLKLPNLSDFDILMGPSQSTQQSYRSVNGKMTQAFTISYTYILRAKKTGKFNILPAAIEVKGKVYQSNSLKLEVVKGQTQQQQSQRQTQVQSGKVSSKDLFAVIELDRSSVYEGQHVLATLKLYTRVNLHNITDLKLPAYDGFWSQNIDIGQIQLKRESYKNEVYNAAVISKMLLYPQQSGKIKIDPFQLVCQVRQQSRRRSLFDDFWDTPSMFNVPITSRSATINVKPLPAKPANFSGAVGQFKIKSTLDKTEMSANDAATLKVSVSGNGNLELVDAPKIDFPADFELYDPKSNNSTTTTEQGNIGSNVYEYVFQPRSAGKYTIPAVEFTYFNPRTKKYETKSTRPYTINVSKGNNDQNTTVVSSFSKEDVRFIGKDIRYIKLGEIKLRQKGETFYGTISFYLSFLIAVVAFIIVYLVNMKRIRDNANVALMRNKKAGKVARKHLKLAASFKKANKQEAFYDAILKAFWGYLSDKLNIAVADLGKESALNALKEANVKEELINEFIDVVETCEFAQFAPSAANANMQDIYSKAESVMNQIDKQIGKR